jgi:hypothetical protein
LDFTLNKYRRLLDALRRNGYQTITFTEYLEGVRPERFVILRHDVDKLPLNSLATARIEKEADMKASYYFRAVPESWDEGVIREIASSGHEVGYHYESLTTCKGDMDAAYRDFENNLMTLRQLVPVRTICMHGSPRSPYDSRKLWEEKDYRNLGILGEPYFDVDFFVVFYLTDTGRRWDGFKVSVRDKIESHQDNWRNEGLVFHTTDEIIRALDIGRFPSQVMITTHPQRWTNSPIPWIKEFLWQNVKNLLKIIIIGFRAEPAAGKK